MPANAFDVLKDRGFVQQVTDEAAVRTLFDAGPVTAYVGYDPTADSLHVGHLFTTMALIHLEQLGHVPIALLGGGTAMVGDPSGKTEMRQMLSAETIRQNADTLRRQLRDLLHADGGRSIIADNSEWLLDLHLIDFLRDIGRHFSVNRMLAAEAYKLRLERGLSFIEFNYQLLQAYDFLELRRRHGCVLQMGGDDQWGNILAGVDLVRRVDQKLVHGLTFPLQLTATGEKMGKTAAGAVWLDPNKLRPYDYFQYWVNTHDDDVVRMLGYFTFLPMDEVRRVGQLEGAAKNQAKSVLAYEATKLVHGKEAAKQAHVAAMGAFGGRAIAADILPSSDVPRAAAADVASLPTTVLEAARLEAGVGLLEVLVEVGMAASKSAARRLIDQGAVKVNDQRMTDQLHVLDSGDLHAGEIILRAGKKRVHRLVVTAPSQ